MGDPSACKFGSDRQKTAQHKSIKVTDRNENKKYHVTRNCTMNGEVHTFFNCIFGMPTDNNLMDIQRNCFITCNLNEFLSL